MEHTAPAPVSPAPQTPKFVRWAVVLGIVVVLNAFLYVAATLVFSPPEYEAFCPNSGKSLVANTEGSCIAQDGTWNAYPEPTTDGVRGYCDFYQKCQEPWEQAMKDHSLKVFSFLVIAGIVAIVAGVLLTGSSIVSSGLSYGGVLALIIGSVSYWGDADEIVRLLISGVALLALLFLGWKKFRD